MTAPLTEAKRTDNYLRQAYHIGRKGLTARQERRIRHKAHRELRGGAS